MSTQNNIKVTDLEYIRRLSEKVSDISFAPIDYYPNTEKYRDILAEKTDDVFHILKGFCSCSFKSIDSFKSIGMTNFMPVYEVIGEKEESETKIKLVIWISEITDKKTQLSMKVFKPDFKDTKKWKYLYTTVSYDEFFIAKQINQVT